MSSSEDRRSASSQKIDGCKYPAYHRRNSPTVKRNLCRSQARKNLASFRNFLSDAWKQISKWFRSHKGLITIFILTIFLFATHPWSPDPVKIVRLKNDVSVLFNIVFEAAKISLIFILFGFLLLLISWLSGKGAGTIVLPFENLTESKEAFLDGRGIANLIIAELHRIRYLHHDTPEVEHGIKLKMQNFAPLSPNNENLDEGMKQVSTISFANSQVHLGSLLIALRKLWPFGDSGQVISGSIQQYGKSFRLIACIENRSISAWEAKKDNFTPEDLPELARELAFKIVIHLNPSLQVKSWKALYWFTEALAKYQNYKQSGKVEELDSAFSCCCETMGEEKEYDKLSNLFCRIGVSFFKEQQLDNAKGSFLKSLEIDPENTYGHFD